MTRPTTHEAAQAFIAEHHADCTAAFLAGSVVRGEGTATSDLDIMIVTTRANAPYRESLTYAGWPVEAFVHTIESVREFFASDAARRRPSLPMMVHEGILLHGDADLADTLKAEARQLLDAGPPPLTDQEIANRRYFLTDLLDDLAGSKRREETLFIAAELAQLATEFILATNGWWLGKGKWTPRALRRFDPALAEALHNALEAVYTQDDPAALIAFADEALAPHGGRLFDGYKLGG